MERVLALLIAIPITVSISVPKDEKSDDNLYVIAEVRETFETQPEEELVDDIVVVTETFVEEVDEEVIEETSAIELEATEETPVIELEVIEGLEVEVTSEEIQTTEDKDLHTGKLTARKGYITDGPAGYNGNDGYETWYDLDMTRVVEIMDDLMEQKGKEDGCVYDYEYWVREDGCKMYGPYIMVAGDIVNTRKRGDIIETSLDLAMVCDYCEYAVKWNNSQIDIATDWAHTYSQRD